MKKFIIAAIVALLILVGFTTYVYVKAHEAPPVQVINNEQSTGPATKYIPRIPVPSYFPAAPASPIPAGVSAYFGTWVATSVVGRITYPAVNASTYGIGKTVVIEPNIFTNNTEMYPDSTPNPQYNIINPSTQQLIYSHPQSQTKGVSQWGIYGGIPTLVVNQHGVKVNLDPKFNFGNVYLDGDSIIVNSNGAFMRCVRKK